MICQALHQRSLAWGQPFQLFIVAAIAYDTELYLDQLLQQHNPCNIQQVEWHGSWLYVNYHTCNHLELLQALMCE